MEQIYDTVNDGRERSGYTVVTGEPGIGNRQWWLSWSARKDGCTII